MVKKKTNVAGNPKQQKKNSNLGWVAIAAVLLIVLLFLFLRHPGNGSAGLPAEVSVSEAVQMQENGAFILDVREPSEWVQGHIPGATLIPLGDLSNRTNEFPRDQEIVVVCRSGNRSAQGRDLLLKAGFTQVTSMAGGMNQWISEGYAIVTGE